MRYYFDIRDDFYAVSDADGGDFATVDEARREAIAIAVSIARDVFNASGSQLTVTVRDEVKPLLELTLTLSHNDVA
jgi:hypothetical protein